MVFRTAYRITGNAADAEDVLQTVFLRLLRREPGAEALENAESYLRRAAINTALDVLRARQTERAVVLQDLPADPSQRDLPELRQALGRALAQLKPREREILWLAYVEGSSHREIAQVVGVRAASIRLLLFRARQKIRKLLHRPGLKIPPPPGKSPSS